MGKVRLKKKYKSKEDLQNYFSQKKVCCSALPNCFTMHLHQQQLWPRALCFLGRSVLVSAISQEHLEGISAKVCWNFRFSLKINRLLLSFQSSSKLNSLMTKLHTDVIQDDENCAILEPIINLTLTLSFLSILFCLQSHTYKRTRGQCDNVVAKETWVWRGWGSTTGCLI